MGILCAGITAPAVSASAISNSTVPEDPICFGSLDFTPRRPAFDSLSKGVELMLGDLRFCVSKVGVLRLKDSAPAPATKPTSSSTPTVTPASLPTCPPGGPDSTPASVFCIDCDAHHIVGPTNLDECQSGSGMRDACDCTGYESCNSSDNPTHRATLAQVYMAGLGTGNGEVETRTTIIISPEAMARAQAAVNGGVPMAEDATREDLMAYHRLLREQQTLLANAREELDERRRLADARVNDGSSCPPVTHHHRSATPPRGCPDATRG